MNYTIGIDPGLGGGLALLDPGGAVEWIHDMPSARTGKGSRRIYDLHECWGLARGAHRAALAAQAGLVVALERMVPAPRTGRVALLALGRGEMLWEAIAVGLGASLERILPAQWQRIVGAQSGERAALIRARELWPQAELHMTKHSGRAAALCIAEAVRRARGGG